MSRKRTTPPRGDGGRFVTAERTTKTTHEVTERVTVEEAAPPIPTGAAFYADPSAPVFSHLLWNPPADRWAHPAFIADMATRAAAGVIDHTDPFPPRSRPARRRRPEPFTVPAPPDTAPIPVIRVPIPRTYPELEPATLAHEFEAEVTHEFTEADRERLSWTLGGGA